jgi:hypothetical protein
MKASEWWRDCEVEESPGQVGVWQKQFVVNLTNEKEQLGFHIPDFITPVGYMGTSPRLSS